MTHLSRNFSIVLFSILVVAGTLFWIRYEERQVLQVPLPQEVRSTMNSTDVTPIEATSSKPVFTWGVKATLHGCVYTEPFFGPPGYGEDPERDVQLRATILRLDTPALIADPTGAVSTQSEVQLVDYPSIPTTNKEECVEVTGELKEMQTGYHRRAYLLTTVDVRPWETPNTSSQ